MINTNEFDLIIIGVLFVLHLLIIAFFIIYYLHIRVPYPGENRTARRNLTALQVVETYLQSKPSISNFKVVNDIRYRPIYRTYYNNTFYINDLPLFNQPYYLSGLSLDYVLGRLFYATQLHQKNQHVSFIRWWLYWVPIVSLLLFYCSLIITLVFYIMFTTTPNVTDNIILYRINKFHIFTFISVFLFLLYCLTMGLNNSLKTRLENLYEQEMTKFVRQEFSEIFTDWIIARRYARSVNYTYLIGCNYLFKRFYRYTGPFSL